MSVLDVDVADGITTLSLNRPDQRNAMNPEMVVRLADAWTRVRDDDGIRVVVLTGAGSDTFSAGGDLRTLITLLTRTREPADEWDERLLADQRGVMNTAMTHADVPDAGRRRRQRALLRRRHGARARRRSAGRRRAHDAVRRIMRSADAKEGAQAFVERRDPVYTGT